MGPALQLGGGLITAFGQAQGQNYASAQAKRAAMVSRIQADQTDASYRAELNDTISNIRALRAGSGTGAGSPTEMAYIAGQTEKSDRDRMIDVGNKNMQAAQDEQDAAFRKRAATVALFGGSASAIGKNAGGIMDFFGM